MDPVKQLENGWYLKSAGYMVAEPGYQKVWRKKACDSIEYERVVTFVHVIDHEVVDSRTFVPSSRLKEVSDENAKLRELVEGLLVCEMDDADARKVCPLYDDGGEWLNCKKERLMRELGIVPYEKPLVADSLEELRANQAESDERADDVMLAQLLEDLDD